MEIYGNWISKFVPRVTTFAFATLTMAALLACGCTTAPTGTSSEPVKVKVKRVLWIGSSSTTAHHLPIRFAWMLTDNRLDFPVQFKVNENGGREDWIIRGGTPIHLIAKAEKGVQGLKGLSVKERITQGDYDYVVFQMLPKKFIETEEGYRDMVDTVIDLCKWATDNGVTPVIYPTSKIHQALPELSETARLRHEQIKKANLEVFQRSQCRFAPCAMAWEVVKKERPEIDLSNGDFGRKDSHPGPYGVALNLFCLSAAITGKSPEGYTLKPFKMKVNKEDRKALRLTSNIPSENFKFDPKIIEYLQHVAWDVYQKHARPELRTKIQGTKQ